MGNFSTDEKYHTRYVVIGLSRFLIRLMQRIEPG
jgi:hypothetical protein